MSIVKSSDYVQGYREGFKEGYASAVQKYSNTILHQAPSIEFNWADISDHFKEDILKLVQELKADKGD